MDPTPLAQALMPQLAEALASVAKVVAPRATLATLSQTVRWSIVDYGITLLAPPLLASLRTSAPGPRSGADALGGSRASARAGRGRRPPISW